MKADTSNPQLEEMRQYAEANAKPTAISPELRRDLYDLCAGRGEVHPGNQGAVEKLAAAVLSAYVEANAKELAKYRRVAEKVELEGIAAEHEVAEEAKAAGAAISVEELRERRAKGETFS